MPAEWAPHEATWIAWPHNEDDWPGRFEPIPWVYGEIVRKLSQVERVRILMQNDEVGRTKKRARKVLSRKSGVQWDADQNSSILCETDRVWARDFAPLFVRNDAGEVAATKWRFNGWAKYENHQLDDEVTAQLQQRLIPRIAGMDAEWYGPSIVLEGGSIDVNGAGLLLTTEECLLDTVQARNPGLSRGQRSRPRWANTWEPIDTRALAAQGHRGRRYPRSY